MKHAPAALAAATALVAVTAVGYPVDDFERTGIRRLPWQQKVNRGEAEGPFLRPGARWKARRVRLRMRGINESYRLTSDTPTAPSLQAGLELAIKELDLDHYGVALLDLSNGRAPRYAAVDAQLKQTPGSIGKLVTSLALLSELAKRRPEVAERERILRETTVVADGWAVPNSHDVPILDGDRVVVRPIRAGDSFSLWEWLDHALSASSNAAGSVTWREAALLRLLDEYPPAKHDEALYRRLGKKALTNAAYQSAAEPLAAADVSPDELQLRRAFTGGAYRYIDKGESYASPLGMAQWMLAMEQGRLVDPWTSRELKRLLYSTNERRRMTAAPELHGAAAFSKSGSLYKCKPEPRYACAKFLGNELNLLSSVAVIEVPRKKGERPRMFILAVASNQLKRHAAQDHARLMSRVYALVVGDDPPSPPEAP